MNGLGFSQFFYKYPEELDKAADWVRENDVYGLDLYYCVQLLKRPIRQKEYVLPVLALWADLDECHPKNLGRYGEPKPQILVQSSEGRWQAYWLLKEPMVPEKAEEFTKRIARAYHPDGCDLSGADLTQILRLPTRNWKRVSDAN